jgi:hypothetical protein
MHHRGRDDTTVQRTWTRQTASSRTVIVQRAGIAEYCATGSVDGARFGWTFCAAVGIDNRCCLRHLGRRECLGRAQWCGTVLTGPVGNEQHDRHLYLHVAATGRNDRTRPRQCH